MADVISPFPDELLHIVRQFTFEQHFFSCPGMYKTDGLGMEGMTGADSEAVVHELSVFAEYGAFYDLIASIGVVVEEGMPGVLHVYSYLVGTACLQDALYQGGIAESFQDLIMSDGFFSMFSFWIGVE